MHLTPMAPEFRAGYESLVDSCSNAGFTHSLQFLDLLENTLGSKVSARHMLAVHEERVVGALPAFVHEGPIGPVVNSLPFFGSHGGPILLSDSPDHVGRTLTDDFFSNGEILEAPSMTIIEPYANGSSVAVPERYKSAAVTDDRVTHLTTLPSAENRDEAERRLMAMLHQKTRNAVRKGFQSGIVVDSSFSSTSFRDLWLTHSENMAEIGGRPKSLEFFEEVKNLFVEGRDFKVYRAEIDGEYAAGLLVFFFKETVEYFTPVVTSRFRSLQPLSRVIFEAMVDAVLSEHLRVWNWGGSWSSQTSLQRFKSRWGATSHPYRYNVVLRRERQEFVRIGRETIATAYPNFYVLPFALLEGGETHL